MKRIVLALFALLAATTAHATQRTVTLDVPGMNCGMCPITVGLALKKVHGVKNAQADLDTKQAVVTYEDTQTGPEQLIQATTDAGYPSTVKGKVK